MIQPGLVSITFRKLTCNQVIELVARAGLAGIEWGGDVHVPHGETVVAQQVGKATVDAGLSVSSYGSYYRAGFSEDDGLSFQSVLDTAVALGAPMIRVWAGKVDAGDADDANRLLVAEDLKRIATMAERAGVSVGTEYHGGTLTATDASAQRLILREAAHANLTTYWQPPVGESPENNIIALRSLVHQVSNIHVFQWETYERRPLLEGEVCWSRYLDILRRDRRDRWALMEFVAGDDDEQFLQDAETLKSWLA